MGQKDKTKGLNQKSDIQLIGVTKIENRYCSFRGNYQRHNKIRYIIRE